MSEHKESGGRKTIYVASRVKRAPMWQELRAQGMPIGSTWIDEAGEGDTEDFSELWDRIMGEIHAASALVFYAAQDDFPLKGAYVEVGIAMGCCLPIIVVLDNVPLEGRTMRPIGSWILHRRVTVVHSIDEALNLLREQGLAP